MKIVCDTNVLVSGVLFGGPARKILQLASRGILINFLLPDILGCVGGQIFIFDKIKWT